MSTPDEAVQATLAEQAAAATPLDAVAELDLSAAVPSAADVDALRAKLAEAEAARAAAAAQAEQEAEAEAARQAPQVTGASGELKAALENLHDRLVAVEEKLGL